MVGRLSTHKHIIATGKLQIEFIDIK